MRDPVIYLHRITDGTYFIYKLSNYDCYSPIKLISAGLAYDKGGNYSTKFKRLIEKYNLEEHNDKTHTTSNTHIDFLCRVYLDNKVGVDKISIPKNALSLAENVYYHEIKVKEEKLEYDIELYAIKGNNCDRLMKKLNDLKGKLNRKEQLKFLSDQAQDLNLGYE